MQSTRNTPAAPPPLAGETVLLRMSNTMHSIIDRHYDELPAICRRYHVARLEVFGSVVSGPFDEQGSDVDFLVEFGDVPHGQRFDAFFGLQRALTELFGRRVDLVEDGAPRNPYFIRRLNETRRLVYAA